MKGWVFNVTDQQQVYCWHFELVQQNILWATPLYFHARTHTYHIINPGCVFAEVKLKAKKKKKKQVAEMWSPSQNY